MIDWLNTIDTQVFLALNGLHAPYFDAFMKLFTGKWIWVPMYAAVLFAVVRNYRWRQTLAVLVCVALAITIADQVCATLIRPEVCRLRPSNPANPLSEMVHIVGGYRGGSYGFPSCHAANSFALASFLILLFANLPTANSVFSFLRGRCLIHIRASILECIIQAICLSEQLSALQRVWLWLLPPAMWQTEWTDRI